MTATNQQGAAGPSGDVTGVRRGFDTAYAVLACAFAAALFAQVYLAGAGAFAHHTVHHPFAAHEDLGNVLGVAAVVMLVLALVARVSRAIVIGTLVLALLTEGAQHGLAEAGHDNRWIGGLHAFDGMLILVIASWLAIAGYRRRFS